MEKVLGIGGVFLRSPDPVRLANWYKTHLGIDLVPQDFDTQPWQQEAGPTVFSPFPDGSDYFPDSQSVMLNFRVRDLAAMLAQLSAAQIPVIKEDTMPIGRFAHIVDPDGNAVELWEPATPVG